MYICAAAACVDKSDYHHRKEWEWVWVRKNWFSTILALENVHGEYQSHKIWKEARKIFGSSIFSLLPFFLLTHWEFFLRQHQLRWDVRKIWKCFAGKEVSIIWNYDNFIRRQKERKFQFDFGHKFLFSLTYFFRLYAKGLSFHYNCEKLLLIIYDWIFMQI